MGIGRDLAVRLTGNDQREIPTVDLPHDRAGFHVTGRARFAADLHPADARDAKIAVFPVGPGLEEKAVAMSFEAKSGKAVLLFEAGIARLLAELRAPEKMTEGFVEAFECDLGRLCVHGSEGRVGEPDLGQAFALGRIADGLLLEPPRTGAFLESGVVQQPMQVAEILQSFFLALRRMSDFRESPYLSR